MANVSVAVEIETRTEHDLSTVLQGVADDQSVNVGTLVIVNKSVGGRDRAAGAIADTPFNNGIDAKLCAGFAGQGGWIPKGVVPKSYRGCTHSGPHSWSRSRTAAARRL